VCRTLQIASGIGDQATALDVTGNKPETGHRQDIGQRNREISVRKVQEQFLGVGGQAGQLRQRLSDQSANSPVDLVFALIACGELVSCGCRGQTEDGQRHDRITRGDARADGSLGRNLCGLYALLQRRYRTEAIADVGTRRSCRQERHNGSYKGERRSREPSDGHGPNVD
jgi:hypothetical protein